MAKLESLFPHYPLVDGSEADQEAFIQAYRARRAQDLIQVTEFSAKKKRESLTDDEKALLKTLGIKASDYKRLKEALPDVEEEVEEKEEMENDPGIFDSDDI